MPSTETQSARIELEDRAHAVLAQYHADAWPEKRHEHVFTVRHHPDYTVPTWVECATIKKHEQGRYRRSPDYRRRFLTVIHMWEALPEYPVHEMVGSCAPCTQRWRVENGLSADVSDVIKRRKEETRK